MILKSVELTNFRLHKKTKINFSEKLNFIVGGNGEGKTSVLEGIYFLCTSKSLNQSPDNEVVNFENNFFEISGCFSNLTENKVKYLYNSEEKKKIIQLNEKQIFRNADLIGKFPVVTLTPSDHDITQGSPLKRRKFVDSVISQASNTYLKLYLEYNKTLKQRASLLNQIKESGNKNLFMQLDAWNETLVKVGSQLIIHRKKFTNEFTDFITEAYKRIMGTLEQPKMEYLSFHNFFEKNEEQINNIFFDELEEKKNLEIIRGKNLIGPHRDDFLLKINNYELRKFGSQGQHKTFQIALKFAQFFYIKEKTGISPIFLMDDIFGELDTFRATQISNYLKELGQGFITITDFTNYYGLIKSENDLLIKIENGKVQ